MSDIRDWLEELGLGQYADAFDAEEIGVADLADVTESDLKAMGLPGARSSIRPRNSKPPANWCSAAAARTSWSTDLRRGLWPKSQNSCLTDSG